MTKKIRIRHSGGSATIDNEGTTAKQVGERIQEITGIPLPRQEWKCGYPPRHTTFPAMDPLPFEVDSIHVSEGDQASLKLTPVTGSGDAAAAAAPTALPVIPFDIGALDEGPPMMDPDGYVVRRVVNADNSCLFHSIGNAFQQPPGMSQALRTAVAQAVLADPFTYSEAFLGRPTDEYAAWIQESTSWGGQIELSILSKLLATEIVALDIIRDRHDVYGTEESYNRRIYVIYDGIHYDAVAYCFDPQLPPDMDITRFSPNDIIVLERAKALCTQEHQRKAYTDTSNFTLRCLVCQQGLKGQLEAAQHAKETGHANFSEFR